MIFNYYFFCVQADKGSTPMRHGVPTLSQTNSACSAVHSVACERDTKETKPFQDVRLAGVTTQAHTTWSPKGPCLGV